jgi:precorrin-4/cobalt-precorrin-4 C11-methyltransferase
MTSTEIALLPELLPPPREPSHNVRPSRPMAIHLTIHTLDRLAKDLAPFYGENCPIAVMFDDRGPGEVLQGTLATMRGWTDTLSPRPMRVLVG